MKNIKIFIDMDDTIAKFNKENCLEDMFKEGFFLSLEPLPFIEAIKELINQYDCFILSACVQSPYCEIEKRKWIEKYLPELKNKMFLCSVGTDKAEFLRGQEVKINKNSILLDDYSKNLIDWEIAGGTAIKIVNSFNNKTNKNYNLFARNKKDLMQILKRF